MCQRVHMKDVTCWKEREKKGCMGVGGGRGGENKRVCWFAQVADVFPLNFAVIASELFGRS